MKILYYSSPSFADCDFPLVKALQEAGHDVTYIIKLAPYSLKSTLLILKSKYRKIQYFLLLDTQNSKFMRVIWI